MVRKSREDALATREQLLDAAEQVFRARGVGNATLEEVAAAAGMTRGAVYHHFDSKAEIFEALVRRADMPMDAAFHEACGAVDDPLGVFRDLAVSALRHLAGSPRVRKVYEIVFMRCEYTDELAAVARRQKKDANQCLAQCGTLLDQAVECGQLPKGTDTHLAAQAMHAYIGGLMREWVQAPRSFDLKATAPALIDVFLAGLTARPPRKAA
jgi:TetR/AcrR family acrAB operon transcriptional repressor